MDFNRMKELFLMRHGKSSWKNADLNDYDRPLKRRGRKDVSCLAELLCDEGVQPELILASPAERSRQTVEILNSKLLLPEGNIQYISKFYLPEWQDFIAYLKQLADSYRSVLIVGHNPSLERLLQSLTGETQKLTTSAVARLHLDIAVWSEIADAFPCGKFTGLWYPEKRVKQIR